MRLVVALLAMLVTGTAQAASQRPDYVRESQCRVLRMFIAHVLCGERNEVARTKTAAQPKASKPAASTSAASPAATAPSVAPAATSPPQAPTQPTQASVTASIPANAYATHRIMPPPTPPGFSGGNSSGKPSAGVSVDHRDSTKNNPQAGQNNVGNQPQQTGSANQQQGQQGQQGQAGGNGQGNDKGNNGKHTGQTK